MKFMFFNLSFSKFYSFFCTFLYMCLYFLLLFYLIQDFLLFLGSEFTASKHFYILHQKNFLSHHFFKIMVSYIYNKAFFLFYNVFFYTRQGFPFHLLRDFCNVHNHIVAIFIFLPQKNLDVFDELFLQSFFIS